MPLLKSLLPLTLLTLPAALPALEIERVNVPESITVAGVEQPLVLNGAGVRKRFFIKVYIGALYLPAKESRVETILAASGAKCVRLQILYEEIAAKSLTDAWTDGFKDNNSEAEYQVLAPRLAQFNGLFRSVRRGETLGVDLLADGTTRVLINDETRGVVGGADFQHALLKVWLGDKPADRDLKRAMLGAKE